MGNKESTLNNHKNGGKMVKKPKLVYQKSTPKSIPSCNNNNNHNHNNKRREGKSSFVNSSDDEEFFSKSVAKSPNGNINGDEKKINKPRKPTGAKLSTKLVPEDFELIKLIGMGTFGKVYEVVYLPTNTTYAMKVLKKKQLLEHDQLVHTKTERQVLEMINHPFIVSLQYSFQTPTKLYMVLDYFNGGELFYHLQKVCKFSLKQSQFFAAEIVLALEELHANDVIYRDLKPENVLLDCEGNIKLTDFGLSKDSLEGATLTHTFCGTPEYLAPEVIQQQGYNKAVDWWSLGTLLYEMIVGVPPFYDEDLQSMYDRILGEKLSFPKGVPEAARDILSRLLIRNPKKRLQDVEKIKAHPYFKDINFEDLLALKVAPPFKPEMVEGKYNIDEDFDKLKAVDSPVVGSSCKIELEDFSYYGSEQQHIIEMQKHARRNKNKDDMLRTEDNYVMVTAEEHDNLDLM